MRTSACFRWASTLTFPICTTQVALVHDGKVIESNLPACSGRMNWRVPWRAAHEQSECDLRLQGTNWISLPMESYGGGFLLLSFENVDEATAPIQSRLHKLFLTLAFVCVLVALFCSVGSSSSIVKPLAAVVAHLRNAAAYGQAA